MQLGRILAVLALTLLPTAWPPAVGAQVVWDGAEPPPGVYFYWYEPSFYAGFAPRTQDPRRAHVRLSRGNQVRLTVVLGEAEVDAYLEDLLQRRQAYRELVDAQVIELTTNRQYEQFIATLDEAGVPAAVESRVRLGPEAYRQRSVEIMQALNRGRIFHIRMPVDRVVEKWRGVLTALPAGRALSPAEKLDAVSAILPGRVNLYELSPEVQAALARAVELAGEGGAAFREHALACLALVTDGRYPVRDGHVEALEYTAIYPAGTVEGWTTYRGTRLPAFGVTGVWRLIPRTFGRGITGMVDYLSTNPGYGFITMLPYQHAGGITYNAFHNAGVRAPLDSTSFLPAAWRKVPGERTPAKPYQNLWVVSRGPTSHGCTRLGSGHMSELRQVLPSSSKVLEEMVTFRNLPQCYDVFDIDGDGSPEVMGVKYYLAYRSKDHLPVAAYVSNNRGAFYQWLYGSNLRDAADGRATLAEVPVCRFVGRKAEEAQVLTGLPLYEAEYTPESIQFYRVKPVKFDSPPGFELNRELRKVGTGHTVARRALLLD